jgi:hypothetical protein
MGNCMGNCMGNYASIKCNICGVYQERFVYIEYSSSNVNDFITRYPLEKDGNPFPPLEVVNNLCKVKNLQVWRVEDEEDNTRNDIHLYHIMCEDCFQKFKIPSKVNVKNKYWIGEE